jgi:hypothetical protein
VRELTVQVRFKKHSLGNHRDPEGGKMRLLRSPAGRVLFMATWHRANMRFAAQVLNRHQDRVDRIHWDPESDSGDRVCLFRRYYTTKGGKRRFAVHEAFPPGHVIGLNVVVPAEIGDEDFWQLLVVAGQYRGISQYGPTQWGFFEVESIRHRRS